MNNKALQRNRMRSYFIDAAKELIIGGEELSARKIGKIAGYSYATIYNYFSDLNELMWYVVDYFFDDINNSIMLIEVKKLDCRTRLLSTTEVYLNYFLDNPNVFKFIYNSDLGRLPLELEDRFKNVKIRTSLKDVLVNCVSEGIIAKQDIAVISDIIVTSTRGLLSLHVANKEIMSREAVLEKARNILYYLVR